MYRVALLVALLALAGPASAGAPRILPTRDLWPVWSPDGSRLAFTRVSGTHDTLELASLGTRGVRQLAANAGQLLPDWSPDGRSIAYGADGAIWTQIVDGYDVGSRARLTGRGQQAFAPRWSPDGETIAYLTTLGARNTDLWTVHLAADGLEHSLLTRDAIGVAAWAPDGRRLAFERDDGIYLVDTAGGPERRIAPAVNPGPPAFSHEGTRVAYAAGGRVWVVRTDGSQAPIPLSPPFREIGVPSWTAADSALVYARAGGVEKTVLDGSSNLLVSAPSGGGLVGLRPHSTDIAYAGPRPSCPGHTAIRLLERERRATTLTGSCVVAGTPHADAVEGSSGPGDVIVAGAGNDTVHANDRHTDRVDCGPGHDTAYADRTDRLRRCEIVHR